jgi:hypothetical protein
MGRWMSPDWSAIPEPVPYANPTNPQTLNLYAMVSDNPETFADLDGHDPIMQVAAPAPPAGPGSNMLTNDYDAALQALLASLPPLPVPQQATTPSQNPTDAQAQQQNQDQKQAKPQPGPAPTNPDGTPKAPNEERYVNDKTGDKLDWNKGKPGGGKGWRDNPHWHWVPGGEKQPGHYEPGDTVKRVGFWTTVAAGAAAAGRAVAAGAEACVESGLCEAF